MCPQTQRHATCKCPSHEPPNGRTLHLLQAAAATCGRLLVEAGAALLAVLRKEVGAMDAFVSVLLQHTALTG